MPRSYALLERIGDPMTRQAVKLLMDRLGQLEAQAAGIGGVTQALASPLDSGSQRLTKLADPTDATDAVTLQYLRRYVEAAIALHDRDVTTPEITAAADAAVTAASGVPYPLPQYGTGNIHVAGLVFVDSAGATWKYIGCSDFSLYYNYCAAGGASGGGAAAIAPILAERAGLGFNTLRVFSMMANIANFDPAAYAFYYTDLPTFAGQLAAAGLQLEFTVLADCTLVPNMSTVAQQTTHLNAVRAALAASPNVFIELGNEHTVALNGWNPANFTEPSGIVSARGSAGANQIPPRPPWSYLVDHPPRNSEWPRMGHQLKEWRDGIPDYTPGAQRPCVADEPMGAAELAIAGSRSDVPNDFYWFAAGAMLLGAGATFHSDAGLTSIAFPPVQLACAQQFVAGMTAIPAGAQLGSYTRGGLVDFPLTHDDSWHLRQYARIVGNTATVVVIRPTGAWPGAVAVAPWIITAQTGPSNTVVTLIR